MLKQIEIIQRPSVNENVKFRFAIGQHVYCSTHNRNGVVSACSAEFYHDGTDTLRYIVELPATQTEGYMKVDVDEEWVRAGHNNEEEID